MIRCLIVDDEQHAIDILVHYISQTSYLELVSSTMRPIEALQTVVPLLDDPMEQLPDLISRQDLATNSEDRSLADLEVYYPFGKSLRVAASSAKQG